MIKIKKVIGTRKSFESAKKLKDKYLKTKKNNPKLIWIDKVANKYKVVIKK